MKNNRFSTAQLTLLGLLAAILLLMAYTPLGYLNIGPLAISFNVIPVAISAVVLGPVGGAVAGAIFGLTSFLLLVTVPLCEYFRKYSISRRFLRIQYGDGKR